MTPRDEDEGLDAIRDAMAAGPDGLGVLVQGLGSDAWRVRAAAVEALVASADTFGAASLLVAALGDPESAGRRNGAVSVLSRMGEVGRRSLEGVLGNTSEHVRKLALDALGAMADPAATPAVVPLLGDADTNVRAAAAEALGRMGGTAAAGALAAHLARSAADPLEASAALMALSRAHVALPAERLFPHLGNPLTRPAAVSLLPWCTDPDAPARLLDALESPSAGVAGAAAGALCAAGSHAPSVTLLLEDPAVHGRLRAAAQRLVASRDDEVAASAGVVLAWVPDAHTARNLLAHRRGRAWDAAVAMAFRGGGDDAALHVARALVDLEPEEQVLALDLLSTRRVEGAFDPIRQLVARCSGDLLEAAIPALVVQDPVGAAAVIATRAVQEDPVVEDRAILAAALERLAEEHAPAVRAAMATHAHAMDASTARLVARTATAEDLPRLRAMAADPDAALREAACLGLGRAGADPDRDLLRSLLMDESRGVRAGAADALARVGRVEDVEALRARALVEDPPVLLPVLRALAALDPAAAEEAIHQRERGADGAMHLDLLRAAEALPAAAAERVGRSRLGHAAPEVVRAALRVLEAAGTVPALEACAALLDDPRWEVRHGAAQSVGALLARAPGSLSGTEARRRVSARLVREQEPLVREALSRAAAVAGDPP